MTTTSLSAPDLVITIAYFSIPLQILASLWKYPSLTVMPVKLVCMCILFALFIFMCGAGHLLKAMEQDNTMLFVIVNHMTALVSISTALYLLPMIPNIFAEMEQGMRDYRANEAAAQSQAELSAFMAFLCHEIRNPLYIITSASQFMSDDVQQQGGSSSNLTPDQERGMEAIVDSANLMLRLVQDVLDLSKIEAGKMEFEEVEFNLVRLLDHLRVSQSVQVQQRHGSNVQLKWNVAGAKDEKMPQIVHGDSMRLMQIICNIVQNAVKFTSQGVIQLKATIVRSPDNDEEASKLERRVPAPAPEASPDRSDRISLLSDVEEGRRGGAPDHCYYHQQQSGWKSSSTACGRGVDSSLACSTVGMVDHNDGAPHTAAATLERVYLKIEVSDTGTGIAPSRLEHIFQPYSQAKLSDYRKHGGTGLGLSIVSSLLKLLGGSIHVSSKVGDGSTFTVLYPLRVDPRSWRHHNHCHGGSAAPIDDYRKSCYSAPSSASTGISRGEVELMTTRAKLAAPPICSPKQQSNSGVEETPEGFTQQPAGESTESLLSILSTVPLSSHSGLVVGDNSGFYSNAATMCRRGSVGGRAGYYFFEDGTNSSSGAPAEEQTRNCHCDCPTGVAALPALPPPPQAFAATTAPPRKDKKKKPCLPRFDFEPGTNIVLIVDDNKVNRKIMAKTLAFYGVEYEEAEDGQIAVDMVLKQQQQQQSQQKYGMIFMDLMMPIMDGVEATTILRKAGIDIPIVALTANALTKERHRFLAAGANEFMTKPILREQVHQLCVRHLSANNNKKDEQQGEQRSRHYKQ